MVKRVSAQTVVETRSQKGVKDAGEWRYAGNKIKRGDHLIGIKNKKGAFYIDERDKDQKKGRRKIESNFFIVLNTNRSLKAGGKISDIGKAAVKSALDVLSTDANISTYIKFGPKSAHYKDDKYEDVIESIDWNATVETGEKLDRLHAHIWMVVHHYSQVQIDMPSMQAKFKAEYNKNVKRSAFAKELTINGNPFISVKLLPTSDWAVIIRQYMLKGMQTIS